VERQLELRADVGDAALRLACLRLEFLSLDTEGLTIEHEDPQPGAMRYLAVVGARGGRRARAHFTLWHEITHVLIMPEQLVFKAFRRSPTLEQIQKKRSRKLSIASRAFSRSTNRSSRLI
jgi:hypothetical protein